MSEERKYDFSTKDELLTKLQSYMDTPDDDNIRFKNKIREELMRCPELLYSLNEKKLESELFNEDGSLNEDGEWDRYFGANANIRPFVSFPDVQTEMKNYLCYEVGIEKMPRDITIKKYCYVTFTCFVYMANGIDKYTGLARHDLIMSIIRERFAWSNIFSAKAIIVSDKPGSTDNNYITRTVVYQIELPDSVVQTKNGSTGYINKTGLRSSL